MKEITLAVEMATPVELITFRCDYNLYPSMVKATDKIIVFAANTSNLIQQN